MAQRYAEKNKERDKYLKTKENPTWGQRKRDKQEKQAQYWEPKLLAHRATEDTEKNKEKEEY